MGSSQSEVCFLTLEEIDENGQDNAHDHHGGDRQEELAPLTLNTDIARQLPEPIQEAGCVVEDETQHYKHSTCQYQPATHLFNLPQQP